MISAGNIFGKLICLPGMLLLCAWAASACSAAARVTPLTNTFLEDVDLAARKKNLPFDHSWVRPGTKKANYQHVFFKPVRIDLLPKGEWSRSASALITSEADYMAKAAEIAQYFRDRVVEEMQNSKTQRLTVVPRPMPGALVVEIVLTELEFSHPIARAGALAVPVPGTGAAVSAVSDPRAAFAARITDAHTGTLLATAADRKFAPTRIIDLNKLTVSSSVREVSSLWAESIAQALQGDGFTDVKEKRFKLLPW